MTGPGTVERALAGRMGSDCRRVPALAAPVPIQVPVAKLGLGGPFGRRAAAEAVLPAEAIRPVQAIPARTLHFQRSSRAPRPSSALSLPQRLLIGVAFGRGCA